MDDGDAAQSSTITIHPTPSHSFDMFSDHSKTYQIILSQLLAEMKEPLPARFKQYEPNLDAAIFGGGDRSYYRLSRNNGEDLQMIVARINFNTFPEGEESYVSRHQAQMKLLELLDPNLQLSFEWAEESYFESGFCGHLYFKNYPETAELTKEHLFLNYTFFITQ